MTPKEESERVVRFSSYLRLDASEYMCTSSMKIRGIEYWRNDIQRKTRRLKSSEGIRRERRGEGGEDREGITSIDRRV